MIIEKNNDSNLNRIFYKEKAMDFNFLITYILLPIIYSVIFFKKSNTYKKKITLNNLYITKSLFYYYLAITTIWNILDDSYYIQNAVAGFTIALAIMEGTDILKQAFNQRKEIIDEKIQSLEEKYKK